MTGKTVCIDDIPTCEEFWKAGGVCTPNCIACNHPLETPLEEQVKRSHIIAGHRCK